MSHEGEFQPTNFVETGKKKGEHTLGVAVLTDIREKEKLEEVKKNLPEELETIFPDYDFEADINVDETLEKPLPLNTDLGYQEYIYDISDVYNTRD